MPTPTYTPLATVTLGTTAASVTFSSIPATYRDLVLVVDGTSSSPDFFLRFNGDSSNYTRTGMISFGSTILAFADSTAYALGFESTDRSNNIIQILDYSATDKHKTYLSRTSRGSTQIGASAHRYASTSAITSLAVVGDGAATMSAATTLSLYGIAS
jgi:hypothetical protein